MFERMFLLQCLQLSCIRNEETSAKKRTEVPSVRYPVHTHSPFPSYMHSPAYLAHFPLVPARLCLRCRFCPYTAPRCGSCRQEPEAICIERFLRGVRDLLRRTRTPVRRGSNKYVLNQPDAFAGLAIPPSYSTFHTHAEQPLHRLLRAQPVRKKKKEENKVLFPHSGASLC